MGAKVIVVGGGIAGLTAAHELIDRGFDVHVFERRLDWGGKAASRLEPSRSPKETDALRWETVGDAWRSGELAQVESTRRALVDARDALTRPVANADSETEKRVSAALEDAKKRLDVLNSTLSNSKRSTRARLDAENAPFSRGASERGVPREHGFRFFPSWYRHLPDTMKRIPYRGQRNEYGGQYVFGNLVPVEENLITWARRDPVVIPLRAPLSLNDLNTTAAFVKEFGRMGVGPVEAIDFAAKLSRVLTADDIGRLQLQETTWWEFVDASNKSKAFQEFTRATTMTMVAAKAEEVNAETIGKLALRTLLQPPGSKDYVLDGPTHQKFIEPWRAFLESRGVVFHAGFELESLVFEDDEPELNSVVVTSTAVHMLARLKRVLRSIGYEVANLLWKHSEANKAREKWHEAEKALPMASQSREQGKGALAQIQDGLKSLARDMMPESEQQARKALAQIQDSLESLARKIASESEQQAKEALVKFQDALKSLKQATEALIEAEKSADELDARQVRKWELACSNCSSAKRLVAQALEVLNHPLHSRKRQSSEARLKLLRTYPLLELELAALEAWRSHAISKGGAVEKATQRLPEDAIPVDREALGAFFRDLHGTEHLPDLRTLIATRGSADRGKGLDELDEYLSDMEAAAAEVHTADYFVLTLPVEQLAYFVNRSGTLRARAPELQSIVELSGYTSWMSGIQFYLREPLDLVRGHVVGMDAPWALTAIEQTQFWRETDLASGIKAVISVDIGDWSKRGDFVKKPAWNCNRAEVAYEVWAQLKRLINPEERQARLRDDMLFGHVGPPDSRGTLTDGVNFNLDDSIADLFDRKKQDAYERARSVTLGRDDTTPSDLGLYMWGRRNSYNLEPILFNRVGSHGLRPDVSTSVQNLFLAGDFVKTETDLACMEGANEAARRAVNALLVTAGSRRPPCELWDFNPLSQATEGLAGAAGLAAAGKPLAAAARAATDVATGLLGSAVRSFGRALIGTRK